MKHAQLTGSVLMEFARVVVDLDETEAKAKAVFESGSNGVEWTNAAKLFASSSGPANLQAAAVTAAFGEPLDGAVALTQACVSACDARKAIVDHYNRLCKQIERLDQKAAAMGAEAILAVSAPTARAVAMADAAGLTLIANLKTRPRVLAHAHRFSDRSACHEP